MSKLPCEAATVTTTTKTNRLTTISNGSVASTTSSKIKLGVTKSLPAFHTKHSTGDDAPFVGNHEDIVKKALQSDVPPISPQMRPRLQSRTSFQFNEGLRKQGSVDFTTPRPRIFSRSKDLQSTKTDKLHDPTINNALAAAVAEYKKDCPHPELLGTGNTLNRSPRSFKRQHTLETIADVDLPHEDDIVFTNKDDPNKIQASQSDPTLLSHENKDSHPFGNLHHLHHQRPRSSSSSTSSNSSTATTTNTIPGIGRKISRLGNFSLLGGKRNPIQMIAHRKTSKAPLVRQSSMVNSSTVPTNHLDDIPSSYQSRYGIRRSTLATSLPKVSCSLRNVLCFSIIKIVSLWAELVVVRISLLISALPRLWCFKNLLVKGWLVQRLSHTFKDLYHKES